MLEYRARQEYYDFQQFLSYVLNRVNEGIKLSELKQQLKDNTDIIQSPYVVFVYKIESLKSIQQVKKYLSALNSVYNILSR